MAARQSSTYGESTLPRRRKRAFSNVWICNDRPFEQNLASAELRPHLSSEELLVFLIIVALVWPVMTVGVVGGYGFAVWMYQLVAGPPGPPRR